MISSQPSRCRGISLIELIIAIVILGIAASLVTAGLITMAAGISVDQDIQGATRLAQSCAEHILAFRRPQWSSADASARWTQITTGASSTICNSAANDAAYTRTVSVTDPPVANPPCPSATAGTCKLVTVTYAKTLIGGKSYSTSVNFLLTRY